jgi:hypothetical protein
MTDEVDSPLYYQGGGNFEAIDVIEQFGLNFSLGNCIKYILRAGHKDDRLVDLKKAAWYLNREINKEEDNG